MAISSQTDIIERLPEATPYSGTENQCELVDSGHCRRSVTCQLPEKKDARRSGHLNLHETELKSAHLVAASAAFLASSAAASASFWACLTSSESAAFSI